MRGHTFALLGDAGLVGRLAHRSCSWIRVPAADIKKPLTQEGSPCCLNWSGQHGRESRSRSVTRPAYRDGPLPEPHALGLRLVAEGVKDDDTAAALAALGCDVAQGFAIARPCRSPTSAPGW